MSAPNCPYCEQLAVLVTGEAVYPHRPDLRAKHFYQCAPCGAWVGCHPGTTDPLGRLANAELRAAKLRAHAVFDPIWQAKMRRGARKQVARRSGYQWLAEQLGISPESCHVGMFDVATCNRVVEICAPFARRIAS